MNKTMGLFLDDMRIPKDVIEYISPVQLKEIYLNTDWVIVRNYDEFVKYVTENTLPELISFDHDLADEHYCNDMSDSSYERFKEKTGYECAKWLCDYCGDNDLKLPKYIVHSMNPIGKKNIENYLQNFIKFSER